MALLLNCSLELFNKILSFSSLEIVSAINGSASFTLWHVLSDYYIGDFFPRFWVGRKGDDSRKSYLSLISTLESWNLIVVESENPVVQFP
jgi:hypothetical protein